MATADVVTRVPGAPGKASGWPGALRVVVVAVAVGLFSAVGRTSDVLGWTSLLLFTGIVSLIAWRDANLRAPLLVAFAIRVAAVLVHVYVMPLPGSDLDAKTYELTGWLWSQGSFADVRSHFVASALYPFVIANVYWLLGRSAMMIALINVFAGALVLVNVYRLTALLSNPRAARSAAWVVAFFPTLVLYSSLTMREMAVTLPLSYGALSFARWRLNGSSLQLLRAFVFFLVASLFHPVVLGVIGAAFAGLALRSLGSLAHGRVLTSLSVIIGLALTGGIAIFAAHSGYGYLQAAKAYASLSVISSQQAAAAVDRTAYLQGLTTTSAFDLFWQLPLRLFFFLLVPFPWWVRTGADIIGLVDAMLYAWLVWKLVSHMGSIRKNGPARSVLLLFLGCASTYALVVSNYGTAIRHRATALPLLVALAFAASAAIRRREPAAAPARA